MADPRLFQGWWNVIKKAFRVLTKDKVFRGHSICHLPFYTSLSSFLIAQTAFSTWQVLVWVLWLQPPRDKVNCISSGILNSFTSKLFPLGIYFLLEISTIFLWTILISAWLEPFTSPDLHLNHINAATYPSAITSTNMMQKLRNHIEKKRISATFLMILQKMWCKKQWHQEPRSFIKNKEPRSICCHTNS